MIHFELGPAALEKPARVSLILKVSNQTNHAPPFRPVPEASPPKHMTSWLALAMGLPSLVEGPGHVCDCAHR